ncbi:MAG TPA: hypothetical protein PLA50_02690 [Bacteroidia bacterium]|nr:hypothetical protein [Bacteroidia bacterium]
MNRSARLHLVIGFLAPTSTATPVVVYCGRDGDAARAAMEPDPLFAMKKWVRNPRGVRKVNDQWAVDCGEAEVVECGTAPSAEQFAEIVEKWTEAERGYQTRIAELEAELAELTTKFQGAAPKGGEASEPQAPTDEGGIPGNQAADQTGGESSPGGDAAASSTDLPHNAEAGTGEGDLPGAQADVSAELPLSEPADAASADPAKPGSLTPPKKGRK